jgi:hypothetical protein
VRVSIGKRNTTASRHRLCTGYEDKARAIRLQPGPRYVFCGHVETPGNGTKLVLRVQHSIGSLLHGDFAFSINALPSQIVVSTAPVTGIHKIGLAWWSGVLHTVGGDQHDVCRGTDPSA